MYFLLIFSCVIYIFALPLFSELFLPPEFHSGEAIAIQHVCWQQARRSWPQQCSVCGGRCALGDYWALPATGQAFAVHPKYHRSFFC